MRRTLCALLLLVAPVSASTAAAQALELVASFDPTAGELPESVAADKAGNLYVSMSNTIRKLTPAGHISTLATLPLPVFALGVKVGPDECVYTVSTSLDPSVPGAFVWRICKPGQVEVFAELDHAGGPNDLAFGPSGDLFVTDAFLGRIWRISPAGEATVWLEGPLLEGDPDDPALVFAPIGADGIAFDRHCRHLYVTNLDRGCIVRVKLAVDGSATHASNFVCDPVLRGADGIAFDNAGRLFVAVGAQHLIATVDARGRVAIFAEDGLLRGPSSLVFGTTRRDKHTLYITNLDFLRAFGFEPGVPEPGLLQATVRPGGPRQPPCACE
jgi:hypothetical protein